MIVFNYAVVEPEIVYNIKWTILSHVMHIVNRAKLFNDTFPAGLDSRHFYDAISEEYTSSPAFGIDYLGLRQLEGSYEDLMMLRYVGKRVAIEPKNEHGIMSENRKLLLVHDIVSANLGVLNKKQSLVMYDFSDRKNDPTITSVGFGMTLLESVPALVPNSLARANAMDLTYSITLGKEGEI